MANSVYRKRMKTITATLIFLVIATTSQAQNSSAKTAAPPRNNTPVTPISFETSLVTGTLTLTKEFKPGADGKEFVPVYYLSKGSDVYFNGRKPLQVSLSKQSYDSVFTKTTADLLAKWPLLNQFIEDSHLSLASEEGWVALVKHYNGMR